MKLRKKIEYVAFYALNKYSEIKNLLFLEYPALIIIAIIYII